MKRNLPLTLPVEGSIYPFKIDGHCELHAVDRIDLGQGLMYLRALAAPHKERPTFINDVVRMVRPNDATAWLPVLREHYTMDDEGRAALIAEAKENPYSSVAKNQKWLAAFDAESGPYTPMVVCHNGEDLARAFPRVPNDDLSHDLYATIGDPVPALVWPRQESEQSPTRSETTLDEAPVKVLESVVANEPGMPHVMRVEDFAVGDRVMIIKKVEALNNERSAGWESEWMDETVGQSGRVNDTGTRVLVQLDNGTEWAYAPEALALESACSEVVTPPESAKPRTFNVGDLVTVQEIEADNGYHSAGVAGVLGAVLRHPLVDHRYYVYISKEQGGWFSPEALEPATVHATMNELNASLVEQGRHHGAAWALESVPCCDTPAKPRAYKVGDKVKVARAVLRDSAGHWCFWTGALEMTIGCTGEVLALVPNETAGAYLYTRVDGHEFYYSPEALDPITE